MDPGAGEPSHFQQFLSIYTDARAFPKPLPARPVPTDPTYGANPLPDAAEENRISASDSQSLAALCDLHYTILLAVIHLSLLVPDSQDGIAFRGDLAENAIDQQMVGAIACWLICWRPPLGSKGTIRTSVRPPFLSRTQRFRTVRINLPLPRLLRFNWTLRITSLPAPVPVFSRVVQTCQELRWATETCEVCSVSCPSLNRSVKRHLRCSCHGYSAAPQSCRGLSLNAAASLLASTCQLGEQRRFSRSLAPDSNKTTILQLNVGAPSNPMA